jgi:hypothetical protein
MTKNFSLEELTIRSGERGALMKSPEFTMDIQRRLELLAGRLQELRDEFGKPIYVTSGFRDTEHNERVGGATNSQHLLGNAADITSSDLDNLWKIIKETWHYGWINYYRTRNFIHVDIRNIPDEIDDILVDSEVYAVRRIQHLPLQLVK